MAKSTPSHTTEKEAIKVPPSPSIDWGRIPSADRHYGGKPHRTTAGSGAQGTRRRNGSWSATSRVSTTCATLWCNGFFCPL